MAGWSDWCWDCAHQDELMAWSDRCLYFCLPNAVEGERPWGHHYADDSPFQKMDRTKHPDAVNANRDENDRYVHTGPYVCPVCGEEVMFSEKNIISHLKNGCIKNQ